MKIFKPILIIGILLFSISYGVLGTEDTTHHCDLNPDRHGCNQQFSYNLAYSNLGSSDPPYFDIEDFCRQDCTGYSCPSTSDRSVTSETQILSRCQAEPSVRWPSWTDSHNNEFDSAHVQDPGGNDGALYIKPKSNVLAKFKIRYSSGDNKKPSTYLNSPTRDIFNAQKSNPGGNPNVLSVVNTKSSDRYTIEVVLDGSQGDYIGIDIEAEYSDIPQFVIQAGGEKFEASEKLDTSTSDDSATVWLKSYEYTDYTELVAQRDAQAAEESAELDRGAKVSTITLEVDEGKLVYLNKGDFSKDSYKIKLNEPISRFHSQWRSGLPKVEGWSEETYSISGIGKGYDLKTKTNIDDIYISAATVEVLQDEIYTIIGYSANRDTEHGATAFSSTEWIKLLVKDTNEVIAVNDDATKEFNSPENTLPTANKLVLDLSDIPPNGKSICTDPDSDISYSDLEVISGRDLISTAKISQNKLSFYKLRHKQGDVRLKFKCTESYYNNQEEVTIDIELTNVPENISVVDATIESGYDLGKTTFYIDEETDETFSISLINYDDNTISVGQGTSSQITSNNGISVNVRPLGKDRIDLDYSAGSPEDDYLILPIIEGSKSAKDLKINFVVNDVNSPIILDEELNLETNEDFSKTITKPDFIGTWTDSEGDQPSKIKIVDISGVSLGDLTLGGTAVSEGDEISWSNLATTSQTKLIYTPNQNAVGTDHFWIKMKDDNTKGSLISNSIMKIIIDITNTNDVPTITFPVEYTLTNGKYILEIEEDSFGSAIVSPSDIDEGDNPTIKVSPPSNSQWSNSDISITNNEITFTPPADFFDESGTIMEVRASDGKLESNPIQIIVKVSGVNDLPTSAAKEVSTYRDTKYTFKPSEFQFSDVDSGDTLQKVTITNLPSGGDLKLSGSEVSTDDVIIATELTNLAFYPNFGFVNTTSFSFSVSDGTDYSDTNILSIKVLPSPYGDFSQSCSLGGEKILNSNWCCKTGYTPKPDLTDVTIAGGDVNACKPYQNLPPVASFIASSTNISIGDIVLFNASASQDSDGAIVEYSWDFGDNSTKGTGKTTSHKYTSECKDDPCQITLTVKDNLNQLSTDSIIINLGAAATIPLVDNTTDETIPTLPDTGDDPELTAAQKELVEQQRELAALQKQLQQQDDSGGAGWFLALLILALLGGGGWYAFKKGLFGKKKPPTTTPTSTPTTSTQPTTSPIRNFISTNKQKGLSNEEIRTKLRGKGWRDGDIDRYMNSSRT